MKLAFDSTDLITCHAAGLRLLRSRWRSIFELTSKLRGKGFTEETVDKAITRLTAEGWLDDARFAAEFSRSKLKRHQGSKRISRELSQLGIQSSDSASVIRQAASEEGEENLLRELCAKKIRILLRGRRTLSPVEMRQKVMTYLLGRGYEMSQADRVLREELKRAEADKPSA